MIWWHSKFIDEIDREETTIEDIVEKAGKTIYYLEKLKDLEKMGKIKVKETGSINPIFIEVLDKSIELELSENPIVEEGMGS
jgi:hypothetical protein